MTFDEMIERDLNTVFFDTNYFADEAIFSIGANALLINCIYDAASETVDTMGNVIAYRPNPTILLSTQIVKNSMINSKWQISIKNKTFKIKSINDNDDNTTTIELTDTRL